MQIRISKSRFNRLLFAALVLVLMGIAVLLVHDNGAGNEIWSQSDLWGLTATHLVKVGALMLFIGFGLQHMGEVLVERRHALRAQSQLRRRVEHRY